VPGTTELTESKLIKTSAYHTEHLKWHNRLKVVTDKPKLKSRCSDYPMMMSRKDFLKSHVLNRRQMVSPAQGQQKCKPGRAMVAILVPVDKLIRYYSSTKCIAISSIIMHKMAY